MIDRISNLWQLVFILTGASIALLSWHSGEQITTSTTHYLRQCWLRSLSPYGDTGPNELIQQSSLGCGGKHTSVLKRVQGSISSNWLYSWSGEGTEKYVLCCTGPSFVPSLLCLTQHRIPNYDNRTSSTTRDQDWDFRRSAPVQSSVPTKRPPLDRRTSVKPDHPLQSQNLPPLRKPMFPPGKCEYEPKRRNIIEGVSQYMITCQGIGTETCKVDSVFPSDDLCFSTDTDTNCAVVYNLYLEV